MSRTTSASSGKAYGLARVCRMWQRSRSSVYQRRQVLALEEPLVRKRPGPQGPCSDGELTKKIGSILSDSPFHGEGHRKVWARLRWAGVRTSRRRVLRLMGENGLLAPQRVGHRHGPAAHDGVIITDRPDEMWGTDQTSTVTVSEGQAQVFVVVDHCTGECIGIHASHSGSRYEALEPVRQGVREYFDGFGRDTGRGLTLRHDHGSAYLSDAFQGEIAFLGIESSPAFVREPEGNGCAERFIRTLKENLLWVRAFKTIEELRKALLEFRDQYNRQWILGRHGYLTPFQVRSSFAGSQELAA